MAFPARSKWNKPPLSISASSHRARTAVLLMEDIGTIANGGEKPLNTSRKQMSLSSTTRISNMSITCNVDAKDNSQLTQTRKMQSGIPSFHAVLQHRRDLTADFYYFFGIIMEKSSCIP